MAKGREQPAEPVFTRACVLYDPNDGRIRHWHKTIVFEGESIPDHEATEARARELLTSRGVVASKFSVLHVDATDLEPGIHLRVDVAKKSLIKTPRRAADRAADIAKKRASSHA